MIFADTDLPGVVLIDLERHEDGRGYFARTMCREEFAARGLLVDFAQESISYNRRRGTVRGMHYQSVPHQETKIIRCVRGAIYDVLVDVRPGSRTRLRWASFELSAENGRAVYVPEGFAHGFQSLADDTAVQYRISTPHAPWAAAGLRYDDPALKIDWPEPVTEISDKDMSWPRAGFAETPPATAGRRLGV